MRNQRNKLKQKPAKTTMNPREIQKLHIYWQMKTAKFSKGIFYVLCFIALYFIALTITIYLAV